MSVQCIRSKFRAVGMMCGYEVEVPALWVSKCDP
jgi:hypothetical protein